MRCVLKAFLTALIAVSLFSCATTDFEKARNRRRAEIEREGEAAAAEKEARSEEEILVERLMAESDVEKSAVYVAPPEVVKSERPQGAAKSGAEAVRQNWSESLVLPEHDGVLRAFRYDGDSVFQIYCQTYHITDVEFEAGERLLETPFISETEMWEVGTGEREVGGEKQTHLFIKPSRTGLSSSMIVVTDRRIYHCELKSYKDLFMPVVRWAYPRKLEFDRSVLAGAGGGKKIYTELGEVEDERISFDYKMKWNARRRPPWLPISVYDDGRRTYIVLDEKALFTEMPALFDGRKNLINYRVKRNVLIADELIEKVTLKLGRDKVVITKKRTRGAKAAEKKEAEVSDGVDRRIVEERTGGAK